MPIYLYKNEQTGEIKEVLQSMKEEHKYSENGIEWKRVWTATSGSVDTGTDPFNKQQFLNKTRVEGKESIGGVLDRAKELSEKRAQKSGGKDPVQQAWFKKYADKRQGKRHPLDR
jgi:hypothetical protein